MARLQFCGYHNMVAILEKGEFNSDFHPMVDFIAASPTHILTTVDGIQRIVSESSLRRNLKLRDEDGIVSIPDAELLENLTLMGYNISQNQKLFFQKGEPASPVRDVSEGEACLTESGFIADQDRVTIAKSSTLPHDSTPRVTSPAADEGTTVLAEGIDVPTGSGSIPTAGPPATIISTGSEVGPTAS
nr:hypothetical protein [Tanacetum cinerariifolium]